MAILLQITIKELVTLTTNLITDYTNPHLPVSNIAPFTYKDGETYLSELARLHDWVNSALVGPVNTALNAIITEVATAITTEQTENTTAITNLTNFVNDTVAALTAAVLEDSTIATAVDNPASLTRAALDALYALTDVKLAAAVITGTTHTALAAEFAPITNVSATDTIIAALVVAGTTKTALDAAYAPHSTVSMTDAGIEAIIANVASVTRIELAALFAPIGSVSATDTAVETIIANVSSATHAYLVANFAPGTTVSMTDGGIEAIVANTVSATRVELNSLYAPASTVSATDANIDAVLANVASTTHAYLVANFSVTDAKIQALIATAGTSTRDTLDGLYGSAPGAQALISVKAFGATGDGITDDTIAITNALNSTPVGIIYFPKGTYLISSIISVPTGLRLLGVSPVQSVIITAQAQASFFTLNTGNIIEEIGFSSTGTPTSGNFIDIEGNNCSIKNCRFSNYCIGIKVGSVNIIALQKFIISECSFLSSIVNSIGIINNSFNNGIIDKCSIYGSVGSPIAGAGIQINSGDSLVISDCIIENYNIGIYFSTPSTYTCNRVKVINTIIQNGVGSGTTNGGTVFQCAGNVYNTSFTNCDFVGFINNPGASIASSIGNTDGTTFNNCNFLNNNIGVLIDIASTKNTIIDGGIIAGNTTYGVRAGHTVATTLFVITSVKISPAAGAGANGTGISLGAFANTQYIITGNIILGNTTAQFTDSSTGSPDKQTTLNIIT